MGGFGRWLAFVVGLNATRMAWERGLLPGTVVITAGLCGCAAWALGWPVHEAAGLRAAGEGRGRCAADYAHAAASVVVSVVASVARWIATSALIVASVLGGLAFLIWAYDNVPPAAYAVSVASVVVLLVAAVAFRLLRYRIAARRRRRFVARFAPLLRTFALEWTGSVLSTAAVDRAAAERIVVDAYSEAGLRPPEIVWAGSPAFLAAAAEPLHVDSGELGFAYLDRRGRPTWLEASADASSFHLHAIWETVRVLRPVWPNESDIFPFDSGVGAVVAGVTVETLSALIHETPLFRFQHDTAFLLERPLVLHRRTDGLLHNLGGPAIVFADGTAAWVIDGMVVDRALVEAPETVDPLLALSHPNMEVRRVLIGRIGYERIVAAAARHPVAEDTSGKLWHLPHEFEPIALVEVENATVESDGSRKRYFLRVPPTCATAREAVAWTFGLDPAAYQPEAQS